MNVVSRSLRTSIATVALAGALTFGGLLLGPMAVADFGQISATTAVNIRSAPSTSSTVLAVLYRGNKVTQIGPIKDGWVPVSFNGKNAWISANYVSGAKATDSSPASQSGSTGTSYTTDALNVRTGPGISHSRIGLLPRGTSVTLTGLVSNGFAQITYKGDRAWVSSAYLSDSNANTPTPPAATPGVETPSLPKVIGIRYTTGSNVNIRTTSAADSRVITMVDKGVELKVTGVVENGRAQIIFNGAVRWIAASYISTTKPTTSSPAPGGSTSGGFYSGGYSSGLTSMAANTKNIVMVTREKFPVIVTFYGVRQDSIPDHPSGHAVDLMLPGWNTSAGKAKGWEIANYMRANAQALDIQYIIFDQKIWNASRNSEGWRPMSDRGGSTANHLDHIHITTKGI